MSTHDSPLGLRTQRRATRAITGDGPAPLTRHQATVTAVAATSVTIKLSGSDTAIAGVAHLDSYDPIIGDTVWVLAHAGDLIVLGALAPANWTDYTPTWTAVTTNPTLGNGTLTGRYRQAGNLLWINLKLTWGSTTTGGSGRWSFSLPAGYTIAGDQVGLNALGWDNSATVRRPGVCWLQDTGTTIHRIHLSQAGGVNATTPWTWATSDWLQITGAVLLDG